MLTERIGSTTYTYTYDSAGNIRTKTGGGVSKTWSYPTSGWLDKLTSYYDGSTTHEFSYDASGNPTKWRGLSSLTWETGRRLMSATTTGGTALSYTYDMDGLRLSKTVGSTEHKYIWQGDRLVSEAWGNEYIEFFYDESGTPSSFYYNNSSSTGNNGYYYYVTNLQGDIVGIRNSSGGSVATYEYDAWGAIVDIDDTNDSGIVNINPLRYRGYYYDSETGLYYLQSRYYDPEVCRFINADEYTGTGQGFLGYNTFAYCANNPVTRADGSGVFWDTVLDVVSLAISIKGVIDDPQSGEAWASLAADVVCLVVPGLTGGGAIVKAVTKLDDVVDAAKTVENLVDATKAADSLTDSSKALQTADSLDFGACFIAGTLVLTSSGYVPIESINVGQYVWAADPEADAATLKQVVQTFVNETTELIHVTVNGEEIVCTSEHPFYLSDNGWTAACELSVGDALIAFDNKSVVVEKIEFEQLDSPALVYNFEVEDYHSYYVGQAPILVHNACAQGRGIGERDGSETRHGERM